MRWEDCRHLYFSSSACPTTGGFASCLPLIRGFQSLPVTHGAAAQAPDPGAPLPWAPPTARLDIPASPPCGLERTLCPPSSVRRLLSSSWLSRLHVKAAGIHCLLSSSQVPASSFLIVPRGEQLLLSKESHTEGSVSPALSLAGHGASSACVADAPSLSCFPLR